MSKNRRVKTESYYKWMPKALDRAFKRRQALENDGKDVIIEETAVCYVLIYYIYD